jgi:hypothetical protein
VEKSEFGTSSPSQQPGSRAVDDDAAEGGKAKIVPARLERILHKGLRKQHSEPAGRDDAPDREHVAEPPPSPTKDAAAMEMIVIPRGAEVMDSASERLGAVIAAAADYIVVEQGFFFSTDFYIPRSVIEKIEDAIVHLRVTKQEALSAGWSVERAAEEGA